MLHLTLSGKILIILSLTALFIIFLFYLLFSSYMNNNHGEYVHIKTPKHTIPRNLIGSDLFTIKQRIYNMSPREFEYFTAELLALSDNKRYIVTPPSNDGGRDCILYKEGKETYIECKHFTDKKNLPGRPIVQKLCGSMVENNTSEGLIVTLHGANKNGIESCNKINNSNIANINIDILDINDLLKICLTIDAYRVYALAGIPESYENIS